MLPECAILVRGSTNSAEFRSVRNDSNETAFPLCSAMDSCSWNRYGRLPRVTGDVGRPSSNLLYQFHRLVVPSASCFDGHWEENVSVG